MHFHWPQLLSVQYLPLVLYTLDRAAVSGRAGAGLLAGAVLTLQTLCSYYLAYMAMILAGCYLAADVLVRGVRGRGRSLFALAIAVALPALVMVPLSLPYLRARAAGGLVWLPDVPAEQLATLLARIGSPARVLASHVGWGTAALAAMATIPALRALRDGDRDPLARLLGWRRTRRTSSRRRRACPPGRRP